MAPITDLTTEPTDTRSERCAAGGVPRDGAGRQRPTAACVAALLLLDEIVAALRGFGDITHAQAGAVEERFSSPRRQPYAPADGGEADPTSQN
ncbi:MAG: hypothetical protein JO345_25810 [Streptosporangiaceae bacterium]|nr:hypothetical protein [Streptosporangiaceae bacterium]